MTTCLVRPDCLSWQMRPMHEEDMEALLVSYGVEWLSLLLRWLHVITGIAWIGASFYFVWLDHSLRPLDPRSDLAQQGVSGELWAVHGGGFYQVQKYQVTPNALPSELHWFKWEAYATWLTGLAMLILVYYVNASAMMIDQAVADLGTLQAIAIGLGTLLLGWIVYDLLCKSPLGKRDGLLGFAMFVFIVATAYGLTRLLSGRAAYLHVGAMIGTIMAGNVLMVIIPGQRKLVAAVRAGRRPDARYGKQSKQRSLHNNYLTLPILFTMISHHYAMTYSHAYNWLVLAAIMTAGVLIRHFFNLRHGGKVAIGYAIAGCVLLLAVAIAVTPTLQPKATRPLQVPMPAEMGPAAAAPPVADFSRIQAIMMQRCVSCHADQPTQPGFASAPSGMQLHTPALMRQHAAQIYRRVVLTRDMPLGNMTQMTEEERALVGAWFERGAR